jgi:hypothetical protein
MTGHPEGERGLVTLIATDKDWLGRCAVANKIKITIDGDTLERGSVAPAKSAELIQTFVDRHQRV